MTKPISLATSCDACGQDLRTECHLDPFRVADGAPGVVLPRLPRNEKFPGIDDPLVKIPCACGGSGTVSKSMRL